MNRTKSRNELSKDEYESYYEPYIGLVDESDILSALESQESELRSVLKDVTPEVADVCHTPYTWTIKQVLGHCIDNEKLFGCRVHRFACGDQTTLPGYAQESYVASLEYGGCAVDELIEEFVALRKSNFMFLSRISPECWDRTGQADGRDISVRAIAFLLVGHLRYHLNIVKSRLAS